ncbi:MULTISPECIES: hypothetical protein [Shouchella]|uniref:hypothetical protein n=1 Tax=Shouchella TaxID=2893057 RepID=UPI000BA7601C|nr:MULTISPECIES: hypothetical protein [Shouchella]MCM3380802.1 hypothetical protein [Shouchella rhizosphaerae]PAD14435.1 hypothetical protein CHH73_17665 [Shouchella clausii]PAE79851.1 hypothetical protein CHH77_18285 [Shouchella clausii]
MSNRNNRQHWKLLIQMLLGLTPFLIIGLLLVALFRWGEFGPFLLLLFVPDQLSYFSVAVLGVIVGFIIVVVTVSSC